MLDARKSTDVHELLLESREASTIAARYEELRRRLIRPDGRWSERVDGNGVSSEIETGATEIASLLLDASLKRSVGGAYESLRASDLYDESADTWLRLRPAGRVPQADQVFPRLLNVLILGHVEGPGRARSTYEALKRDPYCYRGGRWINGARLRGNGHIVKPDEIAISPVRNALLAELVECSLQPGRIAGAFNRLRADGYLDPDARNDTWRDVITLGDTLRAPDNTARLLGGILAVRGGDIDRARMALEGASSPHMHGLIPAHALANYALTTDQLLALCLEAELERASEHSNDEARWEIPEILTIH